MDNAALEAPPLGRHRPEDVARAHSLRHIGELDGVRTLAIWAVLVAHLLFTTPATASGRAFIPHALGNVLSHGWLGVDLFFVLSGFLITTILLRTKGMSREKYFQRFYLRRTLRILPLYFVVLTFLLIVMGTKYAAYFGLCAVFVANLAPLFHTPAPDAAGPLWSLAVEEQFYLIWPWLVLNLDARKLMYVAIGLIALEPVARLFATEADLTLTWYRVDGLAMGSLVAAWFSTWDGNRLAARRFALVLIGLPVAIFIVLLPFGILHEGPLSTSLRITQAVCAFGALVVTAVAFSGHPALAILRSPIAATSAVLSYCIYLVHKPLVDGFQTLFGSAAWFIAMPPELATLVRTFVVIALAYALAAGSWRLLERRYLGLAR